MSDAEKKDEGTTEGTTPAATKVEVESTPTEATVTETPVAETIDTKLSGLGLNEAQITEVKNLGAETVADLAGLTEADVSGFLPVLKARKLIAALQPEAPAPAEVPPAAMGAAATVNFDTLLPSVPDDTSWLSALRATGIRKMDDSTVIAAIRAALADKFGLYNIPKLLVSEMETYVDVTEEQVTDEFWKLRKQLTRRNYGDLFEAIEGLDGSFVTDARKNELLSRIDETLWPAIVSFNEALGSWQEAWMQGAANPAAMMMAIAGGAGGVGMPPGMMQPPDCGVLRDAAETVNDALNRTFRGTGVQITAALAQEANQIKTMMENPRLPQLCGVPTRELLLKKLKVDVPPTYPRMEQNLTRFALGIMQCDKVAAGNEELQYFGTLYMLGTQIPWGDLDGATFRDGRRRPAGIGANKPRRSRKPSSSTEDYYNK